jgi:cytidyltransferase-like protein
MASYLVGGALVVAVVILVKPILFPTIISFPWRDDDDDTTKRTQTVILAGSYNPPHLGHLAMLRYLSKRYERVIAVIGFNPNKKYPVSPEQRKRLLQMMIQTTGADNIEVAGKTFGESMDCLLVMASLTWMGLNFRRESCRWIHMAVWKATRGQYVLSWHSKLGKRWQR